MASSIDWLCKRIAEFLPLADTRAPVGKANARTGEPYLPGVASLKESDLRNLLVEIWTATAPDELEPPATIATEVQYPHDKRTKCDLVLSSRGWSSPRPEWAIELKRIQFVGDNGIKNDHGVQKMISPYLKDRSMIHDIERMRAHPLATRHAVIGYAFSYSFASCDYAETLHPTETQRIKNIREVCKSNNPVTGSLTSDELISAADLYFTSKNVVIDRAVVPFANVWRHPCGGGGNVFGWEVA